MKKLFVILAMAALASCGGSSESKTEEATTKSETPMETPAPKTDTIKNAAGADSLYVTPKADGTGNDTTKAAQ